MSVEDALKRLEQIFRTMLPNRFCPEPRRRDSPPRPDGAAKPPLPVALWPSPHSHEYVLVSLQLSHHRHGHQPGGTL